MSFIAAMTQDKVVSSQLIEGGVDSVVFENFIYHTLRHLRTNSETANKDIILLMDNAVIHKHSIVIETARKFKVNILFNAEYSPWFNPIE
jgi:transposase